MNPRKSFHRLLLGLAALGCGCSDIQMDEVDAPDAASLEQVQGGLVNTGVIVYGDDGFHGAAQALQPGPYDVDQLTVGNNTISSVRVPSGYTVTLFDNPGFTGAQRVLTADTDLWASGYYNDVASSLRVDSVNLPTPDVIRHFFPSSVRFATGEDCIAPAQMNQDTGVALYHVGPHPRNASRVMATFALVFKQDCGLSGHSGAHGAEAHAGDIEYFSYTMKRDSSCAVGWRLHAFKTHAHSGDYKLREINERILDSCDAPTEIVSSLGKHALYPSWGDCSKRTPAEYCEGNNTAGFKLYDIGNSAEQGPNLSALFGSTEPRDTLWPSNGDGRFCGGKVVSQRTGGVDCVNTAGDRLALLGTPGRNDMEWFLPDPDLGTNNGCPYGLDKSGGLCYQFCSPGYSGSATMCIPGCPSGFRDDGLYCAKPLDYGRGAGYAIWDKSKCEKAHGTGNCETCGALYYPKCGANYHTTTCNFCTADCPSGTTDIGASCQKHTYDRGVGCLP